ncbi:MAG: hypothetical protein K0S07_501 [Chlamydiales bacterium]|jgi:hypothetical protein|nr:hypothetical protein [Chlamydiales bacterium]
MLKLNSQREYVAKPLQSTEPLNIRPQKRFRVLSTAYYLKKAVNNCFKRALAEKGMGSKKEGGVLGKGKKTREVSLKRAAKMPSHLEKLMQCYIDYEPPEKIARPLRQLMKKAPANMLIQLQVPVQKPKAAAVLLDMGFKARPAVNGWLMTQIFH